jgi:hypothetical protein
LVNDLFNKQPNEEVVKVLKGEVMVPESNIPNFFTNMKNFASGLVGKGMVQNNVVNYNMSNFTIQADNPKELFKNLDMIVRMNKN